MDLEIEQRNEIAIHKEIIRIKTYLMKASRGLLFESLIIIFYFIE